MKSATLEEKLPLKQQKKIQAQFWRLSHPFCLPAWQICAMWSFAAPGFFYFSFQIAITAGCGLAGRIKVYLTRNSALVRRSFFSVCIRLLLMNLLSFFVFLFFFCMFSIHIGSLFKTAQIG